MWVLLTMMSVQNSFAQSTSWTGATSTNWSTSSNWTSGVPTSGIDAIIGDASFTGSFQPVLTATSSCKNLEIGTGTKTSVLTIARSITVTGSVTIGTNGTILASSANRTITVRGNWNNSGTYNATSSSAAVTFSGGTTQTLTGATVFRRLTVNSGTTLLLANGITVNNSLSVSGTFNPSTFSVSGTGALSVNSTGTLLVYTALFTGNYPLSGSKSLNRSSTVNYASSVTDQTVSSALTYGTLRISGGSVKSLAANLPGLSASSSSSGRIYIDAGTFDLKSFTANRSSSGGGSITIAAGSKLMIGGTVGFPSNYLTHSIASGSTVEYYGNNQPVAATTYGNLTLKAGTGSVTKTMPASALVIAGTFTMDVSTGTSLAATAGQNITFNGPVVIGSSSTLNLSSYSHQFKSGLSNGGTLNGNTSTVVFSGIASALSGTGIYNFHNLSFTAYGITASGTSNIGVSGNLSTTTPGLFTHESGGTLTMSGTSKTLSGNGLAFHHLEITGSVSSTANFSINGNFTSNGTFSASSGTTVMRGGTAVIGGSSAPVFYAMEVEGQITTSASMSFLSNLSVSSSGSFTASAGTVTFGGNSILNGTVSLYNVTVSGGSTLLPGSSSLLRIGGAFTVSGTFNVSTYLPNTVSYNAAGAQNIAHTTYYNLVLSGSGTKTPVADFTVLNDMNIGAGATFDGSSRTVSIYRNWLNDGVFTASTSDIRFVGTGSSEISGTTTFNIITVNKSSNKVKVNLNNNVYASSIAVASGSIYTGANSITTTGSRTGNGYIIGEIIRNHAFANGTAYAFEGPDNLVSFNSPSGINQVTVIVRLGEIADFDPSIESVNREYEIIIPSGSYTSATLRYHYENNELNAFAEPFLSLYKHNTGIIWDSLGYDSRDTALNYVELAGILTLEGRYSASGIRNIVRWDGSSGSDWADPANWTTISGANMTNRVPGSTDAAQIGYGPFLNQPDISSIEVVSVLRLGSDQSVYLTISSGSLSSLGSIRGQWSAPMSHIIETVSGTLNTGTDFNLSDGTMGNDIHLKVGTGQVNIEQDLVQSAGSAVTFTGNGSLVIQGNYRYESGAFAAGSGGVVYTGADAQSVASVVYNNLTIDKSGAFARITTPTTVNGSLSVLNGGEFLIHDSLTVIGDMVLGVSTITEMENAVLSLGGNLSRSGTFVPGNGKVIFTGTAAQTCNDVAFNHLLISKSTDALTLTGNITVNGDLEISSGSLILDTFRADRSFEGGSFAMDSGTVLRISGSSHFPASFLDVELNTYSTVVYEGSVSQYVKNTVYGNLILENGGSNVKMLLGNLTVNGDLEIVSGATFEPDVYSIILYGNFTNGGDFLPGSSTLTLNGTGKNITGTTTFNNLSVVEGSYTVTTGNITMNGDLYIESTGSLSFGSNNAILEGDLTNKGSLTSNGTATFTGTRTQTIQLLNSITSTSTGIINFNGTFAPVINSNSSPAFATVNINNTGGVTASVPWYVFVSFNVASGAVFNGGPLTHFFYGNFTNNGTVISEGVLRFTPGAPYSASAAVKLDGVSFNSTGTVVFGGTAPITITQTAPVFNVVRISNTHAGGVTAPGSWNIPDELRIGTGSIFNAGNLTTHVISGSLFNDGTLEGQGSTFVFDGTPSEINGTGTTRFNHLEIASGADLTLNSAIHVQRNFTADGNFNGSGGSVIFSGSTPSVIGGAVSPIEFGDLETDKSGAGTTLAAPVNVNGTLIMTMGNFNTSATNIINITDDATATDGSALSFVNGPLLKTGDDAFVFPVGKGSSWARIGISAPSSTGDAFRAEYFDSPYSNTSTMAGSPAPVLNNVSIIEYWDLSRTSGSSGVQVTLYWENSLSGINNYSSDLVVAHWNGSAWENAGQTAITASTPGNVSSATVTSFSPFTFGSLSPSINPLPVKLLSFSGRRNEQGENVLNWSTASEKDNLHFTIEKSSDGIHFTVLSVIPSKGSSEQVQEYACIDEDPYGVITFYRLKQTDVDGKFFYSGIIAVRGDKVANGQTRVYPNPVRGLINVELSQQESGKVSFLNAMGYVVSEFSFEDGNFQTDLSAFPEGVYQLYIRSESGLEVITVLVQ